MIERLAPYVSDVGPGVCVAIEEGRTGNVRVAGAGGICIAFEDEPVDVAVNGDARTGSARCFVLDPESSVQSSAIDIQPRPRMFKKKKRRMTHRNEITSTSPS